MKLFDLFSGIGGFSRGLERAGFQTVAFCEIDPYCRRVLAKHWPGVPIYEDIRALTAGRLAADGIIAMGDTTELQCNGGEHHAGSNRQGEVRRALAGQSGIAGGQIDAICGGFPCQDISTAGKGAGIEGSRSGLWSEYARLVGELRPRYVIVENVAALLGRGLGRVLGDLAALGYDAEWHCIPASAVGAPHRRDRVWVIAYAGSAGLEGRRISERIALEFAGADGGGWWVAEPDVGRVAHGVPAQVDRLRALGNAVVPQIPELIGRAIMAAQ